MSGAAALGPLLGGWLTSAFSWPWIFAVNVPVGIAVIVGALLAAGLAARTDTLSGEAARYGQALTDSAGSIIPALYAEGAPDTVIAQLGAVFTDAVRLSMVGAGVFLLAGLVGALAVRRAELTMAP